MRGSAPLLMLPLILAGCLGGGGNPNLQPPCATSAPIGVEIVADKERYRPNELMNITLFLNNTGAAQELKYTRWELSMRAYDGRAIRTFLRVENPEQGGATINVSAHGRATLQPRFQPFRVTTQLFEPLAPGLYYLCASVTGEAERLYTGARPFTADPPVTTV